MDPGNAFRGRAAELHGMPNNPQARPWFAYTDPMADNDDYYRQQADDAEQQAKKSISDLDKARWLRIAQGWLALIRPGRAMTDETFDEKADRLGTHQDISKSEQ